MSQPVELPLTTPPQRLPEWFRVRFTDQGDFRDVKGLIKGLRLHTVCEEAHCPNLGECWSHRTATFMILGEICTRACRFCAVATGRPGPVDPGEPDRVAEAAAGMNLRHVVVTSVARDDLPDGGAGHFAAVIRAIRSRLPSATVEVLIPDFQGDRDSLAIVMDARPDVLNHNLETVRRLQRAVRAKATYERSLGVLVAAKALVPSATTKSGLMVGVGETGDELEQTLRDLRAAGCDFLTVGQYLRPSERHIPVQRFYTPDEFRALGVLARELGFSHVACAPLVRSSYHAHEAVAAR
jgi:lipoyl synthase